MEAGEHPTTDLTFDVFIGYRHVQADRMWAMWLHSALETYRLPRRLAKSRGLPRRLQRVFRDEAELAASADLSQEIENALRASALVEKAKVQVRLVEDSLRTGDPLGRAKGSVCNNARPDGGRYPGNAHRKTYQI